MRILVDGDACPVKNIIIEIAKKYNIEVIIFASTDHNINIDYAKIIKVAPGRDSVDLVLINSSKEKDIVITNDYGLASLALSKKTIPISFSGIIFNEFNIDSFLMSRYLGAKSRRSGKNIKGPSKRTKEDDIKFKNSFLTIIKRGIKNEYK
ncbi:UPF0178 protein [Tepiditoga spiralis]|uniref:UPF0178 protein OSSY52_13510 n=1 Tax=Tepiditoga spiralis TaxID=2108365 RepID=A0A7G1G411_9BACT|nr:YaiI/YqxD family protein [Tepiditoga spiralis]BBE31210.1 UPF0178 protein [Tepiditoga spiralis]